MPKTQNRLGKGLSAIIAPRAHASPKRHDAVGREPGSPDGQFIREISVARITPNPNQPRTRFSDADLAGLAESIKANGVLQPILVRPGGQGSFELIAGERRLRAARLAGLDQIPAIVRSMSDAASLEVALIENLQREDLGPLERATAYQQFIDNFNVTADQLARKLSLSRANITNYLRLLKLRSEIREMIDAGDLGMGHARAIAGVNDPQRQLALARKTVRRNLSVRQVEQLAAADPEPTVDTPTEEIAATAHLNDVAQALTRATGLKVTLHAGKRKNSGRVVLHYSKLEEFDAIAKRLGAEMPTE